DDVRAEAAASAAELPVDERVAEAVAAPQALHERLPHLRERHVRRVAADEERRQRPAIADVERRAECDEHAAGDDRREQRLEHLLPRRAAPRERRADAEE